MSTILKRGLILAVATSSLIQMSISTKADPMYFQVQGVFSEVVYSGYDNGVYTDNSATAPASTLIYNNYGSSENTASTLFWGTGAEVPFGLYYSELTFYGSYVPFEDSSTPQYLGQFLYANGSSNADTIIFGAPVLLHQWRPFGLGSNQHHIDVKSVSGKFIPDAKSGAGGRGLYQYLWAWERNLCNGNPGLQVTEGMDGVPFSNPVQAALTGTYVIDPSITLTNVDYAGGDGVVGDRVPPVVPGAPEAFDMGDAAGRLRLAELSGVSQTRHAADRRTTIRCGNLEVRLHCPDERSRLRQGRAALRGPLKVGKGPEKKFCVYPV